MARYIDKLPEPTQVKEKKIICLSFGRNGTMGLMHSMEMMGYKPYHMKTVFEHGASHLQVLNDALDAKYNGKGKPYGKAEFDKWFADYDALLDVCSFFGPELIEAYPDAKFILTYRDAEKWLTSVNNTQLKMVNLVSTFPIPYLAYLNGFMAAWIRFAGLAPKHLWHDKPPGTDSEALKTYNNHNALMQKLLPPEKLLVVKLEDGLGWEEICPFLGHPVPAQRYPRGNDPQEFSKLIRSYMTKGLLPILAVGLAVSAAMTLPSVYNSAMAYKA
ncbi:P-loop containing nucleoside triphosphate hydrolase protein [Xylariomycetidae sp. FL0641]|nr:P-loop containing nucleoside triphosphate hydrolase protein [Xylariomycetidae sp. FL0641]